MDSMLRGVRSQYIEKVAANHIETICADLVETFLLATNECLDSAVQKASDEASALENPTFFCIVRMSLEFLRLWNQSLRDSDYPELAKKFESFSEYNAKILMNLPDPISLIGKSHDSGAAYNYKSSTVVLYFDHIVHETPDGHVESQARVETSLKLLREQKQPQNAENVRKLSFLCCNDILSPPLWLLPLVHSPQYLGVLWKNSEEARTEDLLVPLEFDTEVLFNIYSNICFEIFNR